MVKSISVNIPVPNQSAGYFILVDYQKIINLKVLTPLILLFTIIACKEVDCNDVKQAFYPEEYNLIVEESNVDLTWIKIRGYVPETYKNSNIMVHNNWRFDSTSVDFGDTIVKRRESLNITVHKKDTTLLFEWYCRGKSYK